MRRVFIKRFCNYLVKTDICKRVFSYLSSYDPKYVSTILVRDYHSIYVSGGNARLSEEELEVFIKNVADICNTNYYKKVGFWPENMRGPTPK